MHSFNKIGVAQIGTKHGHAASVLSTILNNPKVKFYGIFEPDISKRNELKQNNIYPWNKVNFIDVDMCGLIEKISPIRPDLEISINA